MQDVRCPHCGTRQRPAERCRSCAGELPSGPGSRPRPGGLPQSLGWWAVIASDLKGVPGWRAHDSHPECSWGWWAVIALVLGASGVLVLRRIGSLDGSALIGATVTIVLVAALAAAAFARGGPTKR